VSLSRVLITLTFYKLLEIEQAEFDPLTAYKIYPKMSGMRVVSLFSERPRDVQASEMFEVKCKTPTAAVAGCLDFDALIAAQTPPVLLMLRYCSDGCC